MLVGIRMVTLERERERERADLIRGLVAGFQQITVSKNRLDITQIVKQLPNELYLRSSG